ncbi:MAG: reverse transcriptase N-terminal domain-containing protein, partial [Candidatus Hatepunaea meridiana]|nr:reverse transcriptase N-terminal domain-containing protein [Candidatus Hatepunaea meridiana]
MVKRLFYNPQTESATTEGWHTVNWQFVNHKVVRLQFSIAKAVREGKWRKVRCLQGILVHSFYAKLLAVKRVTENRGKRTSGVDGELWSTPAAKLNAAKRLTDHNYRAKPLRRVWIPKRNGKLRPLGIPTMHDRAMQALYLLALQPVSETNADYNSYGFRPKRAARDAIEQAF